MERPTADVIEEVIKQSLKESPVWNSLVSTVETEVIKLFEDKNVISISKKKPEQPETVELINTLIAEYMDWMGYKFTNAMFMKELGMEFKINKCRKRITTLLDLEDSNETLHLPLLTVLITMFKNKNGNTEKL